MCKIDWDIPDAGHFEVDLVHHGDESAAGEYIYTLQITRSRPYQKNDNCFVEENNHSLSRAYNGHDRLDTQCQPQLLRQLHELLWLYHNFFQPVMRLQEKQYLTPLHYRRKYDQPKPPFQKRSAFAWKTCATKQTLWLCGSRSINSSPNYLPYQL